MLWKYHTLQTATEAPDLAFRALGSLFKLVFKQRNPFKGCPIKTFETNKALGEIEFQSCNPHEGATSIVSNIAQSLGVCFKSDVSLLRLQGS